MTSERPAYPSDLTDERWALIEPIVTAWRAERAARGLGINGPIHDLRRIVDAILYLNRTGCEWAYLPHDFPPHQTVYVYYAAWEKEGITERLHEALRVKRRRPDPRPEVDQRPEPGPGSAQEEPAVAGAGGAPATALSALRLARSSGTGTGRVRVSA